MSFLCPQCQRTTLGITASMELGPDDSSDERTLQVVHCTVCRFTAIALYEESRRGNLQGESFRHRGFIVSPEKISALKKNMQEKRKVDPEMLISLSSGETSSFEMILRS